MQHVLVFGPVDAVGDLFVVINSLMQGQYQW